MEPNQSIKRPSTDDFSNSKRPRLTQRERAKRVVQESDVGITEYINEENKTGGFSGALKTLYSDFMVNEIDMNNTVIHLLDEGVDLGKSRKKKKMERRQQERAELQGKTAEEIEKIKEAKRVEEESKPKYTLSDEHRTEILSFISEDELKKIEELFSTGNKMETTTTFSDKQARGKFHQLLRNAFEGKVESVTSNSNTISVMLSKNSKDPRGQRRQQSLQEAINHVDENGVVNYGLGPYKEYLHFTVYKENRETMEVANMIAKFLRNHPKTIHFAGTKDRRGVTCQKFSLHRGKVGRVSTLNNVLKNAVLGGFSYESTPLTLGSLKGNEFIITIRDVKPINEGANINDIVTRSFDSLKNNGFINYYGMQRFGTFSVSTHVLGIHILKSDWKAAVELILSEQEVVAPESIDARRVWAETGDANLTLKKLPRRFTAEHSILSVLAKEPKNDNGYNANSYFKSLISIPRNLRLMYVHAYQSYIWNQVASKRIELFGLEVQVGDLVLVNQEEELAAKKRAQEEDDFEEEIPTDVYQRARVLTQEDLDSGNYSIFDVVLPTPGFDILYPSNEKLKQVYIDAMAKDGLDPDNMARKVRDFSLSGSYRSIMGKAENLTFDIVDYKDDSVPLVRTDLDLLRSKKEAEAKGETVDLSRVIKPEESPDNVKRAVILSMQLSTSCYATMALREFMKSEIHKEPLAKPESEA